jgi:hypothetical protein
MGSTHGVCPLLLESTATVPCVQHQNRFASLTWPPFSLASLPKYRAKPSRLHYPAFTKKNMTVFHGWSRPALPRGGHMKRPLPPLWHFPLITSFSVTVFRKPPKKAQWCLHVFLPKSDSHLPMCVCGVPKLAKCVRMPPSLPQQAYKTSSSTS